MRVTLSTPLGDVTIPQTTYAIAQAIAQVTDFAQPRPGRIGRVSAIRLFRQLTGHSLRECKLVMDDAIERSNK